MSSVNMLRARLRLERLIQTPDTGGGFTESWQLIEELWAELAPAGSGEQELADHLESRVKFTITIRYRNDITAADRFTQNSDVFAIHGIFDPDTRRQWLVCKCTREQKL